MELTHKEKTTLLQRSIELGTTLELNLLHPTRYKQHNPNLADGAEAIGAIHGLLPHGEVYANVVRAFHDGDFAFVHVDYHLFEPTVAFDIHRYEEGVAVEHWDNLQPTPMGRNKSGRTMIDGKTQAKDHDKTQANRALVSAFVREVLIGQDTASAGSYFEGDALMQHNPHLGDGAAEFLARPSARYDTVHQVLGEGSFVLAVSEGRSEGRHSAFYDLFRVEQGKIAEHWDVIEEIPAPGDQKNSNGKF